MICHKENWLNIPVNLKVPLYFPVYSRDQTILFCRCLHEGTVASCGVALGKVLHMFLYGLSPFAFVTDNIHTFGDVMMLLDMRFFFLCILSKYLAFSGCHHVY